MTLVLGLGNDGPDYRLTRHNVGFMVVDLVAERCGASFDSRGDLGRLVWTAAARLGDESVVLAKPRTLMNGSGRAAAALRRKYPVEPSRIVVVYDDADLALGRIRVRPEGGAGGHNGIRSLIEYLGARDFPRVKLGIRGAARDRSDLADYVLAKFHPDEREAVAEMVAQGADAVRSVVREGVASAQRRFNGPVGGPVD